MRTSNKRDTVKWFPLALILFGALGLAKDTKPVRVEGVLVEKQGSLLRVLDAKGKGTMVRVEAATEIFEDRKNFLREPLLFQPSDLRLGLSLIVKGVPGPDGSVTARKVKFTNKARKVAKVLDATLVPVNSRLNELTRQGKSLQGEIEDVSASLIETRDGMTPMRRATRSAQVSAGHAIDSASKAHQRIDLTEEQVASLGDRLRLINDFFVAREELVLFAPSSAKLTEEAKLILGSLAEELGDSGSLVEVIGFASADGDENFNRRLSQQRAEAAQRYLIEHHGVELRRFVSPFGLGELQPLADNGTPEGRSQNRRAQIRILSSRGLSLPAKVAGSAGGNGSRQ